MLTAAWLIELGQQEHHAPTVWWTGEDDFDREGRPVWCWTTDANRARKFACREDAERAIADGSLPNSVSGGRATEHVFVEATP